LLRFSLGGHEILAMLVAEPVVVELVALLCDQGHLNQDTSF